MRGSRTPSLGAQEHRDLQEMATARRVRGPQRRGVCRGRVGVHAGGRPPKLQRPYVACGFRPMIELLRMLRRTTLPATSSRAAAETSCGRLPISAMGFRRSG